jgi:hypothetical protein
MAMSRTVAVASVLVGVILAAATSPPVAAHHGWGSYDAARAITVEGEILTSTYENPHVVVTVKAADKVWTVTLAPTSRMENRGALKDMVAVGQTIAATGYPSRVEKNEMRAERITVSGKTIEMR